jgi:hypothetical protein
MRIETITRNVLKYDELTQDQKTKALDNLDLSDDFSFQSESTLDYFKEALTLLGFSNVDFAYRGFWSQGDGASFTASFQVPKTVKELKARIKAVKADMPSFNLNGFSALRFDKDEKESGTISVYRICHHYSHSSTVTSDHGDLKEFSRDISNNLYRALEKDNDYVNSKEYKEDAIEANEWEFYGDTLKMV